VEDADEDVVEEVVALALELELEAELVLLLLLPQPAATAVTTRPNAHIRNERKLIPARSSHTRAKSTLINGLHPSTPTRDTLSDADPIVHRC
jgi:hypothetical protein